MNRTSRITATILATLLAAAPAAAFAQSSTTGAPGSGTGTSEPGMTTGAPTANQPTAAHPGDTGQGQQFSQSTLENVQEQLQQQGFYKSAKVDGRWGPQTRRAVQSFQQAKGMPATGQLDEQTLGALGVNNQGG
jgi:peptidoglycan hydrolase-like protein with peptidoglycan-binding domain